LSVAFSSDSQHIVSGSRDSTIRMWDIIKRKKVTLIDQFVISMDGWISIADAELLIWIPAQYRKCLHHPSNIWIAGQNETCLDFFQFVHGKNWTSCYLPV
jgi:WD40 repeat protein